MFAAVTGQELPSGVSVSAVTPEVLFLGLVFNRFLHLSKTPSPLSRNK